jgi:oligopeptide transport system permease protein
MIRFLLRKLAHVILVLLGTSLITFLLMHAIPGSPWSNYSTKARLNIGAQVDLGIQNELSRRFGLDLPLWRQYTRYLIGDIDEDGAFFCGAICGNLGPSIRQRGRSVQSTLFEPPEGGTFWQSEFGYSIRLVFFSGLIAVGLGVLLGSLSARRAGSWLSRAISIGLAGLISIPNFVLGLLAIIVLASWLHLIKVLPDWRNPVDWIVPAIVLAVMPMAGIARMVNATLVNLGNEDFVRTARAKGLTKARILWVHVMRNALVPLVTFLGPTLLEMFAGLFIVENLYSFPGMGRGYWISIIEMDYPMVIGQTLIYAAGIALINVLVEVLCEALDPRLRAIRQPGAP